MSIVYDYLKQIQATEGPAKDGGRKPSPTSAPAATRSRIPSWVQLISVFFLCLGVGLAVYFLAPRAVKPLVKLYHPSSAVAPVSRKQSADPSYILEGIIYNPSQPFAIINGKMLENGNTIGDYKIVKITPDSVTLLNTSDKTSRNIHL